MHIAIFPKIHVRVTYQFNNSAGKFHHNFCFESLAIHTIRVIHNFEESHQTYLCR